MKHQRLTSEFLFYLLSSSKRRRMFALGATYGNGNSSAGGLIELHRLFTMCQGTQVFSQRADSRRSVCGHICGHFAKTALFYPPQVHTMVYKPVQVLGFTDLAATGSNNGCELLHSVGTINDCN